jgi:hypothetical protein
MAKRNTTGLPKKKRAEDGEEIASGGNLISQLRGNLNDEAALQRLIVAIVIGVVVLLAVLVGGALLWEQVIVPRQQVASVNGEPITVAQFKERVRLERAILNQRFNLDLGVLVELGQDPNQLLQQEPYGTWWQEISGQPELLGVRVLNDMIEEQIVRQVAAERGIEIDPDVIEREVERFFNFNRPAPTDTATEPTATTVPSDTPTPFVSPTPTSTPRPTNTPEPTPTPLAEATEEPTPDGPTAVPTSTPRPTATAQPTRTIAEREEQFNQRVESFYDSAQRQADLSEETVRGYFEYQALLDALEADISADISAETTYVNARHILVETEAEAEAVIDALEEGENFADLARAVSTDTGSGGRGGELDWSPATNFVPEFRDAVLEAPIGETYGPVESQFGFHIIQVREREEREMTENELDRAQAVAFNEWLEEITSEETNAITRGDNWPQHVPLEPQYVYNPVTDAVATPVGEN